MKNEEVLMKQSNTTSNAPARVRKLTDSEAHDLGVRMIERLTQRTARDNPVARVMRAVNSMRHQAAGAVDAAVILTQLSPEDARRLTSIAAEIVHGGDRRGANR
jgi:hypothetical protein